MPAQVYVSFNCGLEMRESFADECSAYRMIKDDLTLDGTPTLNLASFVTTYMVSSLFLVEKIGLTQ